MNSGSEKAEMIDDRAGDKPAARTHRNDRRDGPVATTGAVATGGRAALRGRERGVGIADRLETARLGVQALAREAGEDADRIGVPAAEQRSANAEAVLESLL